MSLADAAGHCFAIPPDGLCDPATPVASGYGGAPIPAPVLVDGLPAPHATTQVAPAHPADSAPVAPPSAGPLFIDGHAAPGFAGGTRWVRTVSRRKATLATVQ